MLRKVLAAAIIVLVGAASAPASAEPRGRGEQSRRSRNWRGRRQYWHPGRGWDYDPNPLGSFLGGIIGGWLGSQMNKDDEGE